MGNCDTHVFLGSNSFKTVEYFSKALGEKTIGRDSVSINRDRQNWKTGKSVSDQVMARALMTPDELRRMDNDECIIFEKGIKPVKAKKFYYFKHPMARKMAEYEISHNDIGEIDRGKWRKYNPYNPYVEEDEKQEVKDLKIESLDDLFEDDITSNNNNNNNKNEKVESYNKKIESIEVFDELNKFENDNKEETNIIKPLDLNDFEEESIVLPQDIEEDNKENEEEYDLQKELEAKFDELFGPLD